MQYPPEAAAGGKSPPPFRRRPAPWARSALRLNQSLCSPPGAAPAGDGSSEGSARAVERQAPHRPGMDRRPFLLTSLAIVLPVPRGSEAQLVGKIFQIGVLDIGSPAPYREAL